MYQSTEKLVNKEKFIAEEVTGGQNGGGGGGRRHGRADTKIGIGWS